MQYAEQPHRVFPFRWIFPLGQLVLCLFIVSVVELLRAYIPYAYAQNIFESIADLNLPGILIQLPTVIFSADHGIWRPIWLNFQLWRAVSWTASAMVFWWIAGRAAEALVAIQNRQLMPKIGWVETVTGFLIMAAGATLFGGMLFGLSPSERDWESSRVAAAGGLWALLGGLSVIARFRQWRLHRRQALQPSPSGESQS